MSYKKPRPLLRTSKHEPCPVCGEISYSLGGVHPQCAVRQADASRLAEIKRREQVKPVGKPKNEIRPWQKRCPRCRTIQHVRKKTCECGHRLSGINRKSAPEGSGA